MRLKASSKQLLVDLHAEIEQLLDPDAALHDVAEQVRREKVQSAFLGPRNLSFKTYIDENAKLSPLLIQTIDREIMTFDLGVELIAAECNDTIQSLALVTNPGIVVEASGGFLCIGDGAGHALYAMIEQEYHPRLEEIEVKTRVLSAKQRSEKTRSVGSATTICYLPRRNDVTTEEPVRPTETPAGEPADSA